MKLTNQNNIISFFLGCKLPSISMMEGLLLTFCIISLRCTEVSLHETWSCSLHVIPSGIDWDRQTQCNAWQSYTFMIVNCLILTLDRSKNVQLLMKESNWAKQVSPCLVASYGSVSRILADMEVDRIIGSQSGANLPTAKRAYYPNKQKDCKYWWPKVHCQSFSHKIWIS